MPAITRHKRSLLAAAAATLTIAAAGCGGGESGPQVAMLAGGGGEKAKSAEGSGAFATTGYKKRFDSDAEVQAAAGAYAKCLRSNGLPDYPDPTGTGALYTIAEPWKGSGYGKDAPQVLKAAKACAREFGAIAGPPNPKDNAQLQKEETKKAQCVRKHRGFGDYPDPEVRSDGEIDDHLGAENPIWDRVGLRKALTDCGMPVGPAVK